MRPYYSGVSRCSPPSPTCQVCSICALCIVLRSLPLISFCFVLFSLHLLNPIGHGRAVRCVQSQPSHREGAARRSRVPGVCDRSGSIRWRLVVFSRAICVDVPYRPSFFCPVACCTMSVAVAFPLPPSLPPARPPRRSLQKTYQHSTGC